MFGTLLQIKLRTKVIVTAPVGPNLVLASPAPQPKSGIGNESNKSKSGLLPPLLKAQITRTPQKR